MEEITILQGRSVLSEQVAQRLEQMIMNDLSQLQKKLPSEQTLALGFGVSRPVVREALAILRDRGLVQQKQGGGCYVTSPNHDQLGQCVNRLIRMERVDEREVFEARVFLEVAASRLAAENASVGDIEELEKITRQMSETNGDIVKHAALDQKFHQLLAEMSGNHVLALFLESLTAPLTAILESILQLPHVAEDGVAYHNRIIDCLRKGDADASEEIMRQHMMMSMRNWEVVRNAEKEA